MAALTALDAGQTGCIRLGCILVPDVDELYAIFLKVIVVIVTINPIVTFGTHLL